MTAAWTILAVLAGGIAAGIAVLLVRGAGPTRRVADRRPDPPHKRATDYLASGTLPRWDP